MSDTYRSIFSFHNPHIYHNVANNHYVAVYNILSKFSRW